jgi:hypothetical protein
MHRCIHSCKTGDDTRRKVLKDNCWKVEVLYFIAPVAGHFVQAILRTGRWNDMRFFVRWSVSRSYYACRKSEQLGICWPDTSSCMYLNSHISPHCPHRQLYWIVRPTLYCFMKRDWQEVTSQSTLNQDFEQDLQDLQRRHRRFIGEVGWVIRIWNGDIPQTWSVILERINWYFGGYEIRAALMGFSTIASSLHYASLTHSMANFLILSSLVLTICVL